MQLNCFTHYNIMSLLFCIYYNNFYNLYAITSCWTMSIFVTFHSAIIYDKNTYVKIRKKLDINFIEFHICNFFLHSVPCIYIYYYPPDMVNYYHCYISLLLKYIWVYISTNKTMDLSNIYIKFSSENVKKLYATSFLSALIVPTYYKLV